MVVSTSAIDCLERLVSEMTYYVSSWTSNPTHSLTHSLLFVLACVGYSTFSNGSFSFLCQQIHEYVEIIVIIVVVFKYLVSLIVDLYMVLCTSAEQ